MDEVLSQAEVDALLGGFDEAAEQQPEPASASEGVRDYDIAKQERIVRGRMPTLEIINERFARNLRVAVFNFMRRTPEVSIGPVQVLKYSAFINDLVLPTNFNLVQNKPLRGTSLVVFEPTLVFTMIDTMFGGSGKVHTRIEGREFTATELRLIRRLLDIVVAEYQRAWAPIYQFQFEYLRSEMQPQFATIATPSEVVITSRFDIDLGGESGTSAGGAIHFCTPYTTIEPIRDLLLSSVQADTGEMDHRWVGMLSSQVQDASVEMVATLATIDATVKQIMSMRAGDVLGMRIAETVPVGVAGIPLFEGRPGTVNGNLAVRVERFLGPSNRAKNGAPHAR